MNLNLRYPNITGFSEKEQLAQIKSFLHQLVDQLNYATPSEGSSSTQTYQVQGAEISYYELRSLIIQGIQDMNEDFKKLSQKMESDYVPKTGWEAGKDIVTDADGNVVAADCVSLVTITANDVTDGEGAEQTGFADDESNSPTIYPIGINYDSIYEALVQGGTVRIKMDSSFVENIGETPYPVETVVAYALTHQGLLLRTISNTIRYLFVNGSYHGDFTEEDNPWDITDA